MYNLGEEKGEVRENMRITLRLQPPSTCFSLSLQLCCPNTVAANRMWLAVELSEGGPSELNRAVSVTVKYP